LTVFINLTIDINNERQSLNVSQTILTHGIFYTFFPSVKDHMRRSSISKWRWRQMQPFCQKYWFPLLIFISFIREWLGLYLVSKTFIWPFKKWWTMAANLCRRQKAN